MYTVSQAAELTGISSTTLRAWEKRYGLVAPMRNDVGYRLYDAAEIEMLREMAARVAGGMRPSQAAKSLAYFRPPPAAAPPDARTPDLVAVAASLDPDALTEAIDTAFEASVFEQVVTSWLVPQIRRLGEAWESGQLSVAQEHFASAGLMTAVGSAFHAAAGESRGPTVLVGLPAGAHHELAIFAFATCLRRLGRTVLYLGADVPAESWLSAARVRQPRATVLGASSPADAASATLVAEALAGSSASVWVGGASRAEVRGASTLPDDIPEAARRLNRFVVTGRC